MRRRGVPRRGEALGAFGILAAVAGLGILAAACSREAPSPQGKGADPPAGSPKPAVAVTAVPVQGHEVRRKVEMVGTLMAFDEVTVRNEPAGTIEEVFVDLGDRVEEGQLLARLDQREARLGIDQGAAAVQWARKALDRAGATLEVSRANVDRAQAVVNDSRVNLRRYQELFAEGAVSASQKDSAQTQYDVAAAQLRSAEAQVESDREAVKTAEASLLQAQAALDLAKKKLTDTEVRAPITGAVKKKLVSAGETIKENTALLILVRDNPLKFTGTVPERFAPEIHGGQAVDFRVDAYIGRTFPGKVSRVSPAVEAETRSLTLEALVPNDRRELRPGFFAKGEILIRTDRNVPFVPEGAVYSFVGVTKVFVVQDGLARERSVQIGQRDDGLVEIVQGVKPGEVVATSNLPQLFDGARITVGPGAGGAPAQ